MPFRFTFNNNYFRDPYQGIPIGGYTKLVEKLLEGIPVRTETDYFKSKTELESLAGKILYTGKIDQFFDYKFGKLEYRSLYFENKLLDTANFQGNAVVNYTHKDVPYTRIIEHKHFEFGEQEKTYVTYEYPHEYSKDKEPYYPINDVVNQKIYDEYLKESANMKHVIFGGRLAEYKYYDMDKTVEQALLMVQKEFE